MPSILIKFFSLFDQDEIFILQKIFFNGQSLCRADCTSTLFLATNCLRTIRKVSTIVDVEDPCIPLSTSQILLYRDRQSRCSRQTARGEDDSTNIFFGFRRNINFYTDKFFNMHCVGYFPSRFLCILYIFVGNAIFDRFILFISILSLF